MELVIIQKACIKDGVLQNVRIHGVDEAKDREWLLGRLKNGTPVITLAPNYDTEKVILYKDKFITTERHSSEKDQLDNLPSCC